MNLKFGDTLIALKRVVDEDWKTALAQHKGPIPEGAEVKYVGDLNNYYGYWFKVEYNKCLYYVNPKDFIKKEEKQMEKYILLNSNREIRDYDLMEQVNRYANIGYKVIQMINVDNITTILIEKESK